MITSCGNMQLYTWQIWKTEPKITCHQTNSPCPKNASQETHISCDSKGFRDRQTSGYFLCLSAEYGICWGGVTGVLETMWSLPQYVQTINSQCIYFKTSNEATIMLLLMCTLRIWVRSYVEGLSNPICVEGYSKASRLSHYPSLSVQVPS